MKMNSNSNSDLLAILEQLKGSHINFFAGLNLNAYQKNNIVNYQFHSGIYFSTYTIHELFFFNGKIVEEDDGRDRFYLEASTESFEDESLTDYSVLYPRFTHKEQTLSHHIIDVVPYYLNNKMNEIFAIHFKCEYDKDFMIKFQFPADGLHLSIEKNEISSFLNSDSFGKKLKIHPITK